MAGHLGMTVGELESRITSDEVSEWMACHRIDFWPWERLEIMLAQLTSLVANALAAKGTTYKIDDFMILADRPDNPEQTPDQMWSVLMQTVK